MKNTKQLFKKESEFYGSGLSFYCLILLVHFFWALSVPLSKICFMNLEISGHSPFQLIFFVGIRLLGAGCIGLVYTTIKGTPLFPNLHTDFFPLIRLAFIMSVLQYIFSNFGISLSSGIEVSIISSTGAFIGILSSAMLFKEDALTFRKIAGCILGFFSVLLLNIHDLKSGLVVSVFGGILILLAQTIGTLGSIYLRTLSQSRNAVWVGSWQSFLGGMILILFGFIGKGNLSYSTHTLAIFPTFLISMISGLALIFSSQLYKYAPLSKVYIFSLLSPILGVILSNILLGESLNSIYVIASLFLDLIGIACVTITPANTP